jgi:hypothetical protein
VNACVRFVLAVSGSLFVASSAAAQASSEPPVAPPADTSAPPSEPAAPPSEQPPVAPPPAPSSSASFPTDTPVPVLAPLPDTPPPPPARAAPARAPEKAPAAAPVSSDAPLAAPSNTPKPDDKKPPEESLDASKDGLFGPFRIGVLFGAGLPSFFAFSGEIRLTRYFGAGVSFGFIPDMHFSYYGQATVSYQDYGIYAHLHPFGGGFLLGAEVGYAHANGSYTASYNVSQLAALGGPSSIDMTTTGSVQTLILTPEIGYVFTWPAGFTFGFDVGAQIPIAPSSVSLQDHVVAGGVPQSYIDSYLDSDRKKVRDTLEKVGQTVLPAFHLRIGWLL